MNSKFQIKSGVLTRLAGQRCETAGLHLIVVAFLFFTLVSFTVPALTLAQCPPFWSADEHPLGLSPFANDGEEEIPVTVTGVLTILCGDDFANKQSEIFYFLKDQKTKEIFKLRFAGKAPKHLRTGTTMTVHGKAKGHELFLALDETGQESVETVLPAEVVAGGEQRTIVLVEDIETVLPAEAVAGGEQRTIVLVVDFLDTSVSCSTDSIRDLMFTDPDDKSIDDFYHETSFGNVWFSGDVAGPYTINYTSIDTCAVSTWAAAAEAAAQADGLDLSVYNRRVYVLPRENTCGWAGLATVGGNPSRAWIFRCGVEDLFGHELGHNLGMVHSSTPSSEYGDTSDIMGYSGYGLRQVNGPHKEQMGWLSPEQVVAVTAGGEYYVAPLELDAWEALAPQVLKIAKPDTDEYYYFSYRQPLGFDANLLPSYLGGLNVHCYKGDGTASRTFFLEVLADGENFVDTANGLAITQTSHTGDYVTVQVELDSSCCTPEAPTVSLSPASQSGDPGTTLDYMVTVTNTDSANCPVSTFSLDHSLPGGWSGALSQNTLTLGPGETATATLSVTSPSSAAEGGYGLNVDISDASEPVHTASASASYVVLSHNDTEPPTVPTGFSAKVTGKRVNLTWNASMDNVGVSGYAIWRDGVRIGDTTGTGYEDHSVTSGTTYTYTVSAYDEAGNISPPSNPVTVTVRGGKKV